jgi:hypothetical protein
VDFQGLLTSQAAIAESLDKARERDGPDALEARTLREGFNLLEKVRFTGRAAIRDVHDLTWLDQLVVARGRGLAWTWQGEHSREAWESLAGAHGLLADLIPQRGSTWAQVPVAGIGGLAALKLERGVAGPIRTGVVPHESLLELVGELGTVSPHGKEVEKILHEVRHLAVEARRTATESAALVYASGALESG